MRLFAALLLMAAAAVLVFTAFAQEDTTVASRTIAPQWGRTVVRSGNVLPANQQLVRLDLAQPTDITLYLSGFDGVAGSPPSAGLYQLTWGCAATTTQQLVVPVVGAAWHVVATRVEVNALLNEAGGGSLQAQAIASVGRPTLQYQHLYNGAANIGVQHVLPLFHPRFRVPRFTQALVVSAFNIVAGTPTVSELNAAGATLLTRPASAYASGLPLDPRTWFVEFAGAAAEYDVLASAQIVE